MEIKGISLADQLKMLRPEGQSSPKQVETAQQPSFMEFLQKNMSEMNQTGLDVDRRIQATINGEAVNPHETTIAIQKADVSFKLMLSVKEQLEQAYQQIMRTAIG